MVTTSTLPFSCLAIATGGVVEVKGCTVVMLALVDSLNNCSAVNSAG